MTDLRPPDPATDGLLWLGHSTVRIEIDGLTVLTDPVLRSRIGPIRRRAPAPVPAMWAGIDLVLISHLHRDHLDLPSLRLLGFEVPIVVPLGAGGMLARAGFRAVTELAEGSEMRLGPITITATHAAHGGFRVPSGPTAGTVGYLLSGSRTVYFAGDTELFPAMADLGRVDTALIPVGGWGPTLRGGHLDPRGAAIATATIEPRIVVPIHWGTFWPIGLRRIRQQRFQQPGEEFSTQAAQLAPASEVRLLSPASAISRHFAPDGR